MTLTTPPDAATATLPSLSGLHHLGLTVRDIDESERWYADVLGMVRVFVEPHPSGGGHTVVINRPETYLFLGLDFHPQADLENFDERRTGLDHLALTAGRISTLGLFVSTRSASSMDPSTTRTSQSTPRW
jgi:glyoxylase I family protein